MAFKAGLLKTFISAGMLLEFGEYSIVDAGILGSKEMSQLIDENNKTINEEKKKYDLSVYKEIKEKYDL